ncbi:MAG: iron-containing alcohol dehydrogenase [Wujia sp.]
MHNFIYETPTKIYFGKDEEAKVGKILREFAPKKVLIHYGGQSAKKSGLLDRVKKALEDENISYVELGGVVANPELSLVRKGIALCLSEGVDFVLAVGGGSVLDSAKDIANGAANPDVDVWDYSLKKCVPEKTLKKGAILTLSAAGSEMSNSCVITNMETGEKRGYSCPCNRMDFAIENPELTYTVSPYQTACGAVDIAMHTIERYFCPGTDTYLTDAIAEAIVKSVIKASKECLKNPYNYEARANMMWASSLAHNGLTECGRSYILTVHQFEHEVSGMYPEVAHGAGLAAIWCSWARYVYRANISRWLQYAANVWNLDIDYEHPEKTIEAAIDMQEQYYASIGMPTNLKCLGVKETDLETLTKNCTRNRTRNLPGYLTLEYEDILNIYKMAYEGTKIV